MHLYTKTTSRQTKTKHKNKRQRKGTKKPQKSKGKDKRQRLKTAQILRLCRYLKKGFSFLAFRALIFAGFMQYPDKTNKRRDGAKNSLICSYLCGLYIASGPAGFQAVRNSKGSKAGKGPEQRRGLSGQRRGLLERRGQRHY